jgi:hypothetical protein
MTESIGLQIKRGLVTLFAAMPGVSAAYLNRPQPIGESETTTGAVINVREEVTTASSDNQITLPQTMQLRVSIYCRVVAAGDPLDVVADPILQAINTVMHDQVGARALPGVQGVTFIQKQPEVDGDAGRLDLFWNIMYRTYQLDLTQVAP